MPKKSNPNVIAITRVYDASVKRVWDAWVIPEQVAEWWGPRGFTITNHVKDVRTAGTWRYTMHGPDGTDYENTTAFLEVVPYVKMVYDHGGHADSPPLFRVTATFEERDGKTTLTMSMVFQSPEETEKARLFIAKASGYSTWDRLAEYLDKKHHDKERFVVNRTFSAPLEKVFAMWSEPKHLSQWLPPTGFTMEYLRADVREGGSTFSVMSNGHGVTMYAVAEYLEVKKPYRLVYTQRFADAKEGPARHPLAPTWPNVMKTVVEFAAEDEDETRVTVTWEPVFDVTEEELATFVAGRPGMTLGWSGSFTKLDGHLLRE